MTTSLKIHLYILLIGLTAACSQEESAFLNKKATEIANDDPRVSNAPQYTISDYYDLDFVVSVGSFQVLFKDSLAIDTFFSQSGIYFLGNDSLLYARVRETKETGGEQDAKVYYGNVEDLVLCTSSGFQIIDPPLFDTYYSSFSAKSSLIYYWGFDDNFENLYACSYDLRSGDFRKIRLSEPMGTDFFAVYTPPDFDAAGNLIFNLNDSKIWNLDPKLNKIVNYFNAYADGDDESLIEK